MTIDVSKFWKYVSAIWPSNWPTSTKIAGPLTGVWSDAMDEPTNRIGYSSASINTTNTTSPISGRVTGPGGGYYWSDSTGPIDNSPSILDTNSQRLDRIEVLCEKTELLYNKLEKLLDSNSKKHNSISYKGFYFVEDTENKSYSILDFDLNLLSKYHDSLDSCKEYVDNYEQIPNIL